MSRLRTLKPGFFTNEDLAACSVWARLAFAGLWVEADRAGRLKDSPPLLRSRIFPFDAGIDMAALLCELAARGFIQRYQAPALPRGVIQITNWTKHQHPHRKEPPSTLPPPPTDDRAIQAENARVDTDTADPQARIGSSPVGSGIWDPEYTHRARDPEPASEPAPSADEQPPPRSGCGNPAHAWCGDRFCVPRFLEDEWRRQRPDDDLPGWYATLEAALTAGTAPIAPDALTWLRARYRARWLAAVTPRTATRRMGRDPTDRHAWTCEHATRCSSTTACITRALAEGRAAAARAP